MDPKDGDIYPKYSFRLSHAEKEWLDREGERRPERVAAALRDYAALDERVYRALCDEYGWHRPTRPSVRVRA